MSADTDRFAERLNGLENSIEQMNERFGDLNSRINRLDDRMETRFDRLDGKMDDRFGTLDGKMDDIDGKIDRKIEQTESRILQRMALIVGVATVILAAIQLLV